MENRIFFKTLKSGSKIESTRLTDIDRVSKYGRMLSLKAFRVMPSNFLRTSESRPTGDAHSQRL
jgi:hypothetical protein